MNGDRHPLLHRQQHGNDARKNDALAASAIAVEQQPASFGRGHPVDDPYILGQVAVAHDRSIDPPEDFAEQALAIVSVAPREVVRRTDDEAFVCDHAVDKRCDSVHAVCRFCRVKIVSSVFAQRGHCPTFHLQSSFSNNRRVRSSVVGWMICPGCCPRAGCDGNSPAQLLAMLRSMICCAVCMSLFERC